MYNKTEEIVMTIVITTLLFFVAYLMNGCTTLHHNPECKCSCGEAKAYFECGGIIQHKELDIK